MLLNILAEPVDVLLSTTNRRQAQRTRDKAAATIKRMGREKDFGVTIRSGNMRGEITYYVTLFKYLPTIVSED